MKIRTEWFLRWPKCYTMLKRTFDLLFSVSALAILSPFLLGIAVWIRLDSRQPAVFRQVRVGLRGRRFRIYKFRTMRAEAEHAGAQITVGADPRITRSGRFLRKYKIDEFLQLINVVRGDMSIVGPRPEVPRYVALYPEKLRELVLSVRPGITDLASIEFKDESSLLGSSRDPERTYVEEVMPKKLSHCVHYVGNRGFWSDLKIIWRTIRAVLGWQ